MSRTALEVKASRKPKFSSRAYNRCPICGRPRAFMRQFGICRICFRNMALRGELPGVRNSERGPSFRLRQRAGQGPRPFPGRRHPCPIYVRGPARACGRRRSGARRVRERPGKSDFQAAGKKSIAFCRGLGYGLSIVCGKWRIC